MSIDVYKLISSKISQLNKKELFNLYALVNKEKKKIIYQEFKKRMLYNNPKDLEDYILNFLGIPICGEHYKENINLLILLLADKGIRVNRQFIIGYTREIKQYIELIRAFELRCLEKRPICTDISFIDNLNGAEFEKFVGHLFEKMGHTVIKITKKTRDQGADLITIKSKEVNVVQAKRYKIGNNIGNDVIRDVVAAIKHYNAHNGVVITTSSFTIDCVKLARTNEIELINRNKLLKLINVYL